jgi:phosphoglycolate phosphatase
MHTLMLFDIDGTLLSAGGMGMVAMERAGQALFSPSFSREGVGYSGRLDPLIVTDLFRLNKVADSHENRAAFRAAYLEELRSSLAEQPPRALPGVHELLDAIASDARPGAAALLTGNFPEAGKLKLDSVGIDPGRFVLAAWGDDSPHSVPDRSHLPPVAMARHLARFGTAPLPQRTTVIGDTPEDVRCAKASGLRCLGVATGRSSVAELLTAGADKALPDLCQTGLIVDYLLG